MMRMGWEKILSIFLIFLFFFFFSLSSLPLFSFLCIFLPFSLFTGCFKVRLVDDEDGVKKILSIFLIFLFYLFSLSSLRLFLFSLYFSPFFTFHWTISDALRWDWSMRRMGWKKILPPWLVITARYLSSLIISFFDSIIHCVLILVMICHNCHLSDHLFLKCLFCQRLYSTRAKLEKHEDAKYEQNPIFFVENFKYFWNLLCQVSKKFNLTGTLRAVGFVKSAGWFKKTGSLVLTHSWRRPSSLSMFLEVEFFLFDDFVCCWN